ncbi:MAG: hypothetical protein ACQKBT_00960, partial [Puniceicoccales bacterium]
MAFILLLLLSIASISSVELKTAATGMEQVQAEQNARLGLMIGLGELQKQLGPDQRISAPGGQRLTGTSTSARKHWVGVYDSWLDSSASRPVPNFRRWLVSGEESVVEDSDAVGTGSTLAPTLVTLVPPEKNSSGLVTAEVEAGLETIDDRGEFAWWIGDENVKAKIGNRLEAAADAEEASNQLQSVPRYAHEFFLGNSIAAYSPLLDTLMGNDQFEILNPGVDWENTPYRHDYTTFSQGLLTNVRSGGLRKDLSLLLQRPLVDLQAELGDPALPLYTTNGVDGFNFFELWRDFNVWGEFEYLASPPSHEDGGMIAAGTPFLVAESTPTGAADDPFLAYKQITLLKTELIYSLISELDSSTGNYDLSLVVDAIYTIWNPSNIALQIPDSVVTSIKTWRPPYDLTLYLDGTPTTIGLDDVYSPNFVTARLGKIQDTVIRPGEVQIQSQGFGSTMQQHEVLKIRFFSASIGWENGSGYKVSLSDFQDIPGDVDLTYKMEPNSSNLHYALVLFGLSFGQVPYGSYVQYGAQKIVDTVPNSIRATDYPDMFPGIPLDSSQSIQVSSLANVNAFTGQPEKWPLAIFSFGVKTESDPDFASNPGDRRTGRSLLRFNPAT